MKGAGIKSEVVKAVEFDVADAVDVADGGDYSHPQQNSHPQQT